MDIIIVPAQDPKQFDIVRTLFREYQASLGIDLCFQSFEEELATLPGKYAPPRGMLLLAFAGAEPAGVIAMRPLNEQVCEMKRLYVRPTARGHRLGQRLIDRLFAEARTAGYSRMRLDTLTGLMDRAIELYRSLGFYEIPPYFASPLPNELFLEVDLTQVKSQTASD